MNVTGTRVLRRDLRAEILERWAEHILARIAIVFPVSYPFFGVGGLWGLATAATLVGLAVLLALRARRW